MLKQRFYKLLENYSTDASYIESCWKELEKKYTASSRHYHDLEHLENMFSLLDVVKKDVDDLDTISFAIFYHDIIYKATRTDNEHQSALLFEKRIRHTTFENIDTCMLQIEATKKHELSSCNDTNILLDLDLSILGTSNETYDTYCKNIRAEYRIFPDFLYNRGRIKALNHLLSTGSIFKTPYFIERFEQKARENLLREMDSLRS